MPVGCSRCSARSLTSPQQQVWGICGVPCAATVKWEFGHPEHPLPGVFVYFTEGREEDRGDFLIQSLSQSLTASVGRSPSSSLGGSAKDTTATRSPPALPGRSLWSWGAETNPATCLLSTPTSKGELQTWWPHCAEDTGVWWLPSGSALAGTSCGHPAPCSSRGQPCKYSFSRCHGSQSHVLCPRHLSLRPRNIPAWHSKAAEKWMRSTSTRLAMSAPPWSTWKITQHLCAPHFKAAKEQVYVILWFPPKCLSLGFIKWTLFQLSHWKSPSAGHYSSPFARLRCVGFGASPAPPPAAALPCTGEDCCRGAYKPPGNHTGLRARAIKYFQPGLKATK